LFSTNSNLKDEEAYKALSIKPRRFILDLLVTCGPLDLDELSRKTNLKTITLRHHMRILENAGLVESFLEERGSPGRPKQYYKIANRYMNLGFPQRQYQLLAQLLLESLIDKKGEKYAATLLREIGEKMGENMMRNLSLQHRIQQWNEEKFCTHVLSELEKMGCYPSITRTPEGDLVIKIFNCIFYEISKLSPKTLCEGHAAYFRSISRCLGNYDVKLEDCIIDGDRCCTTVLKKL
jgi:predicted ArsR family transcriptional regulator